MSLKFVRTPTFTSYANDLTAYNPEWWAAESLKILNEELVMGNLVARDYSREIAAAGDVVNVQKPAAFEALRKGLTDSVTVQNATAVNIPVPLNQHVHVSFLIRDGEISKSLQNLVDVYLAPAMQANSKFIDQILIGQASRYIAHGVGGLGTGSSSNMYNRIVGARGILNTNKSPMSDRYLILTSAAEGLALETDTLVEVDKSGWSGALREGWVGRVSGFDTFMSLNAADDASITTTAGALDAAEAKGQTIISVAAAGDETINHWLTVAGDDTPQMVIAIATGDTLTVWPGLKAAASSSSAVVTHMTQLAIHAAGAQIAGYDGAIALVAGDASELSVGQGITFGVGATSAALALALAKYTIVSLDTTLDTMILDRPLEVGIANDAKVNPMPGGSYNFAFHKNAIALVSRPLALPPEGVGARSAVMESHGLGVRVTITYDGDKQGLLVTVDILCGVAILYDELGCLLYS